MPSMLLGVASKHDEQQVRAECHALMQRLHSAGNTSRLPFDLWLEVFPYLCADVPTLRNLSLTCLFLRNMSIPPLFRSLAFPFPSSLRRAFRLLHSTYIHPYIECMNLTKRPWSLGANNSASSLRVIILALHKMDHLQRLAIDFHCPPELYEYIHNSRNLKHLLWTSVTPKMSNQWGSLCRLEAIEFSDKAKDCFIPGRLILESALTLKSLSVHSLGYLHLLCALARFRPFSNLTSFTFSSTDEGTPLHYLQDILESCPSLIALHLPTPLNLFLSPAALPKLNTLNAGPNEFVLEFVEGRPVRRLFANPAHHFSYPRARRPLQNCSFFLLHVHIEYSYAEEFFDDVNRTLIYCEDLALDVWMDTRTPSDIAVTTLITWLTAPSLVNLSLTIRTRGKYLGEVLDMVDSQCHFEAGLCGVCGGSPNLQQMTVAYYLNKRTEHGFHARRVNHGEWVVRSSLGTKTSTSWYNTATELAETEEG